MNNDMKRYLMIMLTVCAMMMAADVQGQPLVKTHVETGDIEGVIDGTLAVYKAIPYAAPPVGNLRWKAPQPIWPNPLRAASHGIRSVVVWLMPMISFISTASSSRNLRNTP